MHYINPRFAVGLLGQLSLPSLRGRQPPLLIAPRPGVKPATFRSRVRCRTAAPARQPRQELLEKLQATTIISTITHGIFSEAAAFISLHLWELYVTRVSQYRELFECVSVAVRHGEVVIVTRQCQHVLFAPTTTLYLLCVFSQHRDFPTHKWLSGWVQCLQIIVQINQVLVQTETSTVNT